MNLSSISWTLDFLAGPAFLFLGQGTLFGLFNGILAKLVSLLIVTAPATQELLLLCSDASDGNAAGCLSLGSLSSAEMA